MSSATSSTSWLSELVAPSPIRAKTFADVEGATNVEQKEVKDQKSEEEKYEMEELYRIIGYILKDLCFTNGFSLTGFCFLSYLVIWNINCKRKIIESNN